MRGFSTSPLRRGTNRLVPLLPMFSLETKLEQDNPPLFQIYSRIKAKASDIWGNPLLPDFTEHGSRHSEQITSILNRITSYWEKFDLNDSEILVLLASARLHDIGMQNMKEAEGKADILREAHAEYSYKLILKDGMADENIFLKRLDCGFWDEHGNIGDYNLQTCVALVCKGHSGRYFQEVMSYSLSPVILQITDLTVLREAQYPPRFFADEVFLLERETAEMDLFDRKKEKKRIRGLLKSDLPGGACYYYSF